MKKTIVVALFTLSALVGWVLLPVSASAVVPHSGQMLQFNMCGARCNSGSTDEANAVVRSINSRGSTLVAVSLNEVCQSQFTSIKSSVGSAFQAAFVITVNATANCANGAYGDAIFWKTGTPQVARKAYANQLGERRAFICGRSLEAPIYMACSTHLTSSGDSVADKQLGELRTYLVGQSTGSVNPQFAYIVAMGDLNITPTPINQYEQVERMYAQFNEGDGSDRNSDQSTSDDGKIDYAFGIKNLTLFAQRAQVTNSGVKPGGGRYSDHKLYTVFQVFGDAKASDPPFPTYPDDDPTATGTDAPGD